MNPSTVCDCAGTSMSLEEQLKQPWAKEVKPPMNFGLDLKYPKTINRIDFEEGYRIEWTPGNAWQGWQYGKRIGAAMGLDDVIGVLAKWERDRCLKDLQAARTAWEAEEKRKKAPENLKIHAYYALRDGKYVLRENMGGVDSYTPQVENYRTIAVGGCPYVPKEIPLEAVV